MYHIKSNDNMIDFEKGIITGKSGKIYKIAIQDISASRYTDYSIRSSLLAFNTDFETLFTRINNALTNLRHGKENAQGNASNAIVELESILKAMVNYQENTRPAIIEFCSTFCIAENEDISIHTESQIAEKYEDWKHIPIEGFFFVSEQSNKRIQSIFDKHFGKVKKSKSNASNDDKTEWQKFEETCIYLSNRTHYDIKYLKSMFIIDFLKLFELVQKNEPKKDHLQK